MKRILIITGASSGLGREFAFQIQKERAADEIWLLARRKDKLESLALELAGTGTRSAAAPKPRVVEIDLGGRKGIASFSAILEKEHRANVDGGIVIDTLVNNAGFGTYGTFTGTDLDRQLDMIDLNVLTLTGLCHAALPYMTKGSLIINVASLASFIPLGNFAVYAATKAYVLSFSTALAAEVADEGVFVSTVCPGPVDTEFANIASKGARERVVDGRNPADVVAHCLRQIRKKRHSAIMAPKWKFKAFMSRFVGRYFFARHSYVHDKRPSK
jgi:short-subunit dehydrogenase